MRWIVVWVTGAAMAMLGALLLYLGPSAFVGAKGGTESWLPGAAPVLLVAGIVGIGAGTAGMWRTHSVGTSSETTRPTAGITLPNLAAAAGLILAIAALLAVITVTVVSRFAQVGSGPSVFLEALGTLFLAAFPASLSGALISVLALAMGTTRRRMAISGLVVGSAVAIGQVLLELGFMFGGGGD